MQQSNNQERSQCECEHASHFGETDDQSQHDYGHVCESVRPFKTNWGTFKACENCIACHLQEYAA